MDNNIVVTHLNVSAAKSGWLQPVQEANVWFRGLVDDRIMAFVTPAGEILTQRARGMERLALIRVMPVRTLRNANDLSATEFDIAFGGGEPERFALRMNSPNFQEAFFKGKNGSLLGVYDQGEKVAALLSSFLREEVRLVAIPNFSRETDPLDACDGKAARLTLVDQHQISIISKASVHTLNAAISARGDDALPVNERSFRANIVVDGCGDDAENRWRAIQIGEVTFRWVKPITRCPVTAVDQDLGVRRGPEPMRTLRDFRRMPDGKNVWMGGYYVRYSGNGVIRVGDEVTVIR